MHTHRSAHRQAVGQLVLAAICWSFGGLLIKAVEWPGLAVAGGRGLVAALFLFLLHGRLRLRFSWPMVLGAVAYAACSLLFVSANKLTTAANAILLQYTAPVWVALFSAWLLREPARRSDWWTIFCVLGGMSLFFADRLELAHTLGNVLAIAAGVAFAGMAVALRRQKDGSPVESIILGNLLAFLVGLPAIVTAPSLPATGWFTLLALGVVQLGTAYWLYSRAIRHVSALEAVLLPVLEPILNPLWVLLALGEKPSAYALVGGAIVLVAVSVRAWMGLRPTPVNRGANELEPNSPQPASLGERPREP